MKQKTTIVSIKHGERAAPPRDRPVDKLVAPLRAFGAHKASGAIVLLIAAAVALALANGPWSAAWSGILHTPFSISLGQWELEKTLVHWINDGLMGFFFFAVGLEIKREVKMGELATPRQMALPAIAALGGMAIPGLIYFAINGQGKGASGWGVPVATDIAFALGVLAFLKDKVPSGLRSFLAALAIVDDIGAVLVIAVFYTDTVALFSLAMAAILLGLALVMNRLRVRSTVAYFLVGTAVWLAFLQSGVHATIAALLVALAIPARTWLNGAEFNKNMRGHMAQLHEIGLPTGRSLNDGAQQSILAEMEQTVQRAGVPLARMEHQLAPFVAFFVLPLFALANAGVKFPDDPLSMVTASVPLGVALGLFVGKPLGVLAFTYASTKIGLTQLPQGVNMKHVGGVGLLAGIGFTMALFISELAFTSSEMREQAKLSILVASLLSGVAGYVCLRWAGGDDVQGSTE